MKPDEAIETVHLHDLIEPLKEIIGENENTDTFLNKILQELCFFAARKPRHLSKRTFEENAQAAKTLLRRSRDTEFLANQNFFLGDLENLESEYDDINPAQGLTFILKLQQMLEIYQEACNRSCETIDQIAESFLKGTDSKNKNKGGRPRGQSSLRRDFAWRVSGFYKLILQEEITSTMPSKRSRKGAKFARILDLCFRHIDPKLGEDGDFGLKRIVETVCRERKKLNQQQGHK